jgi:hypothetical protein
MICKDTNSYLCSYLDGELGDEKVKAVEEHLKNCQICKNELEFQRSAKFFVQKRFPRIPASESLKKRISLELARAEEYRESGVKSLDLIRWGTHVAQFYNTKNDLKELLSPFLGEGLKDNELCVWIIDDISEEEAKDTIAKEIPNLQECISKKQLQLFSYKDWYLSDGYFNTGKVLNNALTKCQEALSSGYSGFRVTGVVSWIEKSDWNPFMEYEQALDNAMPDKKALIICAYKENKCTTSNISEVMDRHKYSISKIDGSWRQRKSTEQFDFSATLY